MNLFSVTLLAGQTLNANVLAAQIGLSGLDSYLRLFDANGNQVAADDNSINPNTGQPSPDAALTYLAPADGTYYLGVSGALQFRLQPNRLRQRRGWQHRCLSTSA